MSLKLVIPRLMAAAMAVSLILCAFPSHAAPAPEPTYVKVRKEAEVPGIGAESRNNAMQAAKRAAISDTLEKAFGGSNVALLQRMVENPDQYIRSTQLLRVENRDGNTWVEAESYVERDALLRASVKTLLPQLAVPPTALVLVATQNGYEGQPQTSEINAAETAIVKMLAENHFKPVDGALVRALYHDDPALLTARVTGDDAAAGELVKQEFAQVTVLGRATVSAQPQGTNISACSAKLSVNVYRNDGKLMDTLAQEAIVHSADPEKGIVAALEDVCEKISKDLLVTATIAAAGAEKNNDIMLTIKNPGSRERFDQVLANLRAAVGDEFVKELFYSDELARVRVGAVLPLAPLLDAITGSRYNGAALEVTLAVERTVEVTFTN